MNYKKLTITLVFMFASGCTSVSGKYDGFSDVHDACYSYIYGYNDVAKDYQKALKWCSMASDRGWASSQVLLAELYYLGNGVEKDLAKALDLYMKAADQDHSHALFMIYYIYNKKYPEFSSDEQKKIGIVCLKRAAKANYKKAIEEVASLGNI